MALISQAYPTLGNTENYAYLERCWSVADPQHPLYDPNQLAFGSTTWLKITGATGGELGVPDPNQPMSEYAPIGPFYRWKIVVRPQDNQGPNLSKAERIVIDFHGFYRRFDLAPDAITNAALLATGC